MNSFHVSSRMARERRAAANRFRGESATAKITSAALKSTGVVAIVSCDAWMRVFTPWAPCAPRSGTSSASMTFSACAGPRSARATMTTTRTSYETVKIA